jgi:hypothetical protein
MRHQQIHRSVSRMAFRLTEEIQSKQRLRPTTTRCARSSCSTRSTSPERSVQRPSGRRVSITFDEILYDAPAQRNSDNDEPHVWIGKVIDSSLPVFIDAHVSDWDISESGHTTGCTVRVGVFDPSRTEPVQADTHFAGRLHLTIQGLGAPDDQDETDGEGE